MKRPQGKTLAAVFEENTAANPFRPAIFHAGRQFSYSEVLEQATEAAKSLLAFGVNPGDRIGVLLGNEPRWIVMATAASMLGATLVPLNTWYKGDELGWTMSHCGLSLILSASQFLKTDYRRLFTALIPELGEAQLGQINTARFPELRTLIFDRGPLAGCLDYDAFLREGHGITSADLAAARTQANPEHPAYILYTSGSTAEPKGVMLNHRGVVENGFDLGQRRAITAEDRVWIGTPLFYALGATNALPAAITAGASVVLQNHFEAGLAIEVIEATAATVYYGTGNMSRAIIDHAEYRQTRIGSLKKGNAGIAAEHRRMTLVEMGISNAVPAYGLTETYGNATVGLPDDPVNVKLATNGRALPSMEIVIVDPQTHRPLPKGETGLVLVRGHTTPGYYRNPEQTQRVVLPDGFFDTGDLGSFDPEGRLIFHSRLKDVIKSGGINISPIEVEQLLADHPDVRDAFVVGVNHAVMGELVVAFVDAAGSVSETSLKAYVRERAASFKTPHHIFFRHEAQLPRLASGKIAKHKLVAEARRELGLST